MRPPISAFFTPQDCLLAVYLQDTKPIYIWGVQRHKINWELIECRQRPKRDRYFSPATHGHPLNIRPCLCGCMRSLCVCVQQATTSAKVFSNSATLGPWGWFVSCFSRDALKRWRPLFHPSPTIAISLALLCHFLPLSFGPFFLYPWMLLTLLIATACRFVGVVWAEKLWQPAEVGGCVGGALGGGRWCSETEINL